MAFPAAGYFFLDCLRKQGFDDGYAVGLNADDSPLDPSS